MKIEYKTASRKGRVFDYTNDRLVLSFGKLSFPIASDTHYTLNPRIAKGVPLILGVGVVIAVYSIGKLMEKTQ